MIELIFLIIMGILLMGSMLKDDLILIYFLFLFIGTIIEIISIIYYDSQLFYTIPVLWFIGIPSFFVVMFR